jgi:hypothetical protein
LTFRSWYVGGHFAEYQRLGDAAIKVLNDFTPLVERAAPDLVHTRKFQKLQTYASPHA